MVTNPQKLQMRPIEQGPRLHIYSSMIRWCLCSLVILLAAYYVVQPLPLRARAAGPVQELPLVMVEIRYSIPEADEVFLVWGMNGWQQVPPEAQPVGTVIKDSLSYTPMERMDSAFIAKVQVPEGTTIDYVFQITKTRDGETRDIWDTNGAPKVDYHTVAQTGGIVEIQAPPAIEYQVALKKATTGPSWLGLVLLFAGGCVISGITVLKRQAATGETLQQSLAYLQQYIRERPHVAILVFVSVLYFSAINPDLYAWGDNARFIVVGKSIAMGQGFRDIHYPTQPIITYPNLMFPLLLAPIIYLFDYNLWPMKIIVALIGIGAIYLVFRFFRNLLDKTLLILLTLLVAVSPQIVSFSHQVMSEILFMFFSLLSLIYVEKYRAEKGWFTKTGLITALVVAATCLTRTIGLALLLAAIPYFIWEASSDRLRAVKKVTLLILLTGIIWILLNYQIVNNLTYTRDFLEGASNSSDTASSTLAGFVTSIVANLKAYLAILPETILYPAYKLPFSSIALFSFLVVAYGYAYSFFKKRTSAEYYVFLYVAIILLYKPNSMNLGNYQRYLVPVIPFILYYFIQGFRQISLRISDLTDARLDYSVAGNPQPALLERAFRMAHSVSAVLFCALILLNLASTVQASVLRTEPEMFDHYIYDNGTKPHKYMAMWTRENTSPESLVLARNTYLYHFWSHRKVAWYPYVETEASKEQVVQALLATNADYIALDALIDMAMSDSNRHIMDTVKQSPDAFEVVYQDGDTRLYRILPKARLLLQ